MGTNVYDVIQATSIRVMEQEWEVDFFCDLWLAWTFQINFMYDKYL